MDIVTYTADLNAFRVEAGQNAANGVLGFNIDTSGSLSYGVTKVPVHYNGNESLCVVRLTTSQEIEVFSSLKTCLRLGVVVTHDQIEFDDETSRNIYERVRGERLVKYTGLDGNVVESLLPYLIGGFPK